MTAPVRTIEQAEVRSGPVVFALALAVLGFSLMQTLLVPALPELAHSFDAQPGAAGWILTVYLLAGAVTAPILGALGDLHGHRRLLLVTLALFAVGSVLAFFAPSFAVLLVARVVQGAATASFPLALAIVRVQLPAARRAAAIGWLSGMLGLGAGSALVIGGILTDVVGWRGLFGFGAMMALASLAAVARWVPRGHGRGAGRLDLAGAALLAAGLAALLLAISQGSTWGWASPAAIGLFAAAAAGFAGLVLVERRTAVPVVDVRSLADVRLALVSLVTVFLGFVPYLFYVALPILLESPAGIGHGMSVTAAGIAMLPSAVLVFVGGRLAPALISRVPGGVVVSLALVVMLAGSTLAALWPSSLAAVVIGFALIGFGNGAGFAAASDLVTRIAPRDEVAAAAGLNGVLRTVGSAVGIPVTGAILATSAVDEAGLRALFLLAAVASLVAALLGALIRRA
ncbi:MFS transporter [Microbacterium nymphoidis]|uniref:MFS transporter n=1 Tax=Microbacterium nymphoidis TaxID=2898586 RepID=UPI001E45E26C|nr:MFS transporter [Microbacterium nymphoidis]MCD2497804.1 MFS transporter [Microbacterium nymphoidis]